MRIFGSLFVYASILSVLSCKARTTAQSDLNLARYADPGIIKNVALIVPAPGGERYGSTYFTGIEKHISELTDSLKSYGFTVQVTSPDDTPSQIVEATKRAASDVTENGTLMWFFIGHSSKEQMVSRGEGFAMNQIGQAIREARDSENKGPLSRLVVVAESCFSGRFLNGNDPIGTRGYRLMQETTQTEESLKKEAAAQNMQLSEALRDNIQEMFGGGSLPESSGPELESAVAMPTKQLLVLTSSTSEDFARFTPYGGFFTNAFVSALGTLSRQRDATLRQFVNLVHAQVRAQTGGVQQPQVGYSSADIEHLPLWPQKPASTGNGSGNSGDASLLEQYYKSSNITCTKSKGDIQWKVQLEDRDADGEYLLSAMTQKLPSAAQMLYSRDGSTDGQLPSRLVLSKSRQASHVFFSSAGGNTSLKVFSDGSGEFRSSRWYRATNGMIVRDQTGSGGGLNVQQMRCTFQSL
jgi:hypothetical protein